MENARTNVAPDDIMICDSHHRGDGYSGDMVLAGRTVSELALCAVVTASHTSYRQAVYFDGGYGTVASCPTNNSDSDDSTLFWRTGHRIDFGTLVLC